MFALGVYDCVELLCWSNYLGVDYVVGVELEGRGLHIDGWFINFIKVDNTILKFIIRYRNKIN